MPAPVQHAIDVATPPEVAWATLCDAASWTRWFPGAVSARREPGGPGGGEGGGLQRGDVVALGLELGVRLSVRLEVTEVVPLRVLALTGRPLGGLLVEGLHRFELAVKAPGLVRFTAQAGFGGLGARLVSGRVRDRIDEELHAAVARFRALAEAARAEGAA